jgi:hypothetical protein
MKRVKRVIQFIYGIEVTLPLSVVKNGELYFEMLEDKIGVYKKTKKGNILVTIVNNYGELYKVKEINLEPSIPNYIYLNP